MLEHRIRESKILINKYAEKAEGPLIVNFSGGKDSSALLHLVLECTDNVECVFMESSIDLLHERHKTCFYGAE